MSCTFLEPVGLSDHYVSNDWPMANRTASWHPISTTLVNWIVPHQPGHRVLLKTAEILDFPTDKIVFNMTKFANTAGASIPMALDSLYKKDKIKNGDIIVMPAIGSGWTYGVSILKYIK